MAKKLLRRKVVVLPEASIQHFARPIEWCLHLDSGEPIDASYLSHIYKGEMVLEQLVIYLRPKRAKRTTANNILRYLKFLAYCNGAVGAKSLSDFKIELNTSNTSSVNTKSQVFSSCKNFVSYTMSSEAIPTEALPKNFISSEASAKPTIMALAGEEVNKYALSHPDEIESVMRKYSLERLEASALAYGNFIIGRYHEFSLGKIESWSSDCGMVDKILDSISVRKLKQLKTIDSFKEGSNEWREIGENKRTIELAFQILYSKFGRLIPGSPSWPSGISDFCKSRGWGSQRIQSAFFTSAYNLQYFLVAALSHKTLAPNVDSVAFYSYLDTVKPATDRGKVNIHFGKKRGASINKVLSRKDHLCRVLFAYQERLKRLLQEVPNGDLWLNKEQCELFIHYTKAPKAGAHTIRTFDRSSTSDMVRRVTKELAKESPEFLIFVKKLTGECFRPTIAAIEMLSGSSLGELSKTLNHKNLSTTDSYGIRVETQALLSEKLKNFQTFLLKSRSPELPDTGNGYQCGKVQKPKVKCEGLDLCFQCDAKKVVLKDLKLIAEWIAYSDFIKANELRLKFNNPQRWESYWVYRLVEYEDLLSKCTKAELRLAKERAKTIILPFMD